MKVKVFWYDAVNNVGDMLSKPILAHFGVEAILAPRNSTGKVLAIGSIMNALRENDKVWGSGIIKEKARTAPAGVKFYSVRGPLTRKLIKGIEIPEVYGDPALLLPLVYNPDIKKVHEVGIIPHYVDKEIANAGGMFFIDVQEDWQTVVRNIKSCKMIMASSLHGIIIAEAYGIPAMWVRYSDKIIGGDFKFQDYFLGTGRKLQAKNRIIPPIRNLEQIQASIIEALDKMKEDIENGV